MKNCFGRLSIKQKAYNKNQNAQQDWAEEMKRTASFRAKIKIEYRQNFVRILKEKMENLNSK